MSKAAAGAVLIIPAPAVVAAAFITGSDQLGKVSTLAVLVYFMAWIVAGAQVIANWHGKRSRGQPPRQRRAARRSKASRAAGPAMI